MRAAVAVTLCLHASGLAQTPTAPAPPPPANDAIGSALQDIAAKVAVDFDIRYRGEGWSFFDDPARPPSSSQSRYSFHAVRSLVGATYTEGDFSVRVQALDVHAWSLPERAVGGPGQLYFANSGQVTDPDTLNLQAFYLRWQNLGTDGLSARVGRQDFADGLCSPYDDAQWNRLRAYVLTERLVGTSGWSQAARTFDGARFDLARPGWFAQAYGGGVNAGGFDIDDATHSLDGFYVAGAEVTAKAGTWLDDVELRAFGIWSKDGRSIARSTLGAPIEVETFGVSALALTDAGPGQLDGMLWLAGQIGDFGSADQQAWAAIAEVGYRWPDAACQPWLRGGVAVASGDGDPTDADNHGFYNVLPSNHKYYGSADQVALSNVVDAYGQVLAQLAKSLAGEVQYHVFHAADGSSPIVFGTGAFTEGSLGYTTRPTNGSADIGQEVDVAMTWKPVAKLDVQVGYSHFFGGEIYRRLFAKEDLDFFYVQTAARF